jgi:hypothetical protein
LIKIPNIELTEKDLAALNFALGCALGIAQRNNMKEMEEVLLNLMQKVEEINKS